MYGRHRAQGALTRLGVEHLHRHLAFVYSASKIIRFGDAGGYLRPEITYPASKSDGLFVYERHRAQGAPHS